jgi:hypothetical protein
MDTGENLNKTYLAPDYDKDFDDDDDFDEDIDINGEDEAVENFLDKQENLKNSSKMTSAGSSFGSNPSTPWNNSSNNSGGLWNSPPTTPSWGNPSNNNIWGSTPNSNNWGSRPSGGFWNNSSGGNSWSGIGGEKKEINRNKRIIFCDVLDCLVETYQSCGKPGLLPRGIYDIKFRFDVWDKLACFNPEKIFAMVPRALLNSSNEASWIVLLEYIVCSLSEYLRSPYQVCQILLQTEMGQPKEDTMFGVLKGLNKDEVIHLGVNSGLYGQNNKDQIAAKRCGIDYIDLATFMNSYY